MGRLLRISVFLLAVLPLAAGPAAAGPVGDFNRQYADAWAQYRDAYYQSAPGHADPKATAEALKAFRSAWRQLRRRWGASPPPQYSEDADFALALDDVAAIAEQADGEARAGRLDQAHITLGQISLLLAELRHRNGLEAYADQLAAFDEKLAETAADDLDQDELTAEQFVQLCEQVGVLTYLAERMEKLAPSELADDGYFLESVEGVARQLRVLKAAVLDGRRAPVTATLADLRQSFDRLFLLYG